MKKLIECLISNHKTVSTMESCTGGAVVNAFTNVEGSSDVIKFSCVTYSNEYKIKMGVNSDTIDKYSVYSIEVAEEMSKNISLFTDSNYGIGITGKLNRYDKNNLFGEDNIVYISIYDKDNDKFYNDKIQVLEKEREDNKKIIINKVIERLMIIVKN